MLITRKWTPLLVCLALTLFAVTAGCSSSPGQGFTLFPNGNFLLNTTEMLRDAAPRQADIPRELQKTPLEVFTVQPGDVLLIEPATLDSPLRFPSDQTVMPDGTIDLGRYGRRVVAGKSIEEIEAEVQAAVEAVEKKTGPINVRLVTPQSGVYYVLGEVTSPGSFPLVGRETVLDGILAAGGLNDKASTCNIIISRPTPAQGCRIVLPVCYRQIVQIGDTTTNYQLRPGDRIYVATRSFSEQLLPFGRKKECDFCCGNQCSCAASGEPMYADMPAGEDGVTPIEPFEEDMPTPHPGDPPPQPSPEPSAKRSSPRRSVFKPKPTTAEPRIFVRRDSKGRVQKGL